MSDLRPAPELCSWADDIYPCSIPLRRHIPLPLTTVTSQRSWRDSIENRVRVRIGRMLPHDFQLVEGVEVRRLSHKVRDTCYKVGGENASLGFETAVARVLALVSEREAAG